MRRVTLKGPKSNENKSCIFRQALQPPLVIVIPSILSSFKFPSYYLTCHLPSSALISDTPSPPTPPLCIHHRLSPPHHRLVCGEAPVFVTLTKPSRPPPTAPQFCRTSRSVCHIIRTSASFFLGFLIPVVVLTATLVVQPTSLSSHFSLTSLPLPPSEFSPRALDRACCDQTRVLSRNSTWCCLNVKFWQLSS